MINHELEIQNLDHLGIIAGLVDELEIVELVNQQLGEDPRERVSAGVVVKAMILNGLGFISAPLYLFSQFFAGKATQHLLGEGVLAEYLNDDRIGRVLDGLYQKGISDVFVLICLKAAQKFGIERQRAHLDSTSFAVEGEYKASEDLGGQRTPIHITYGYSRDRRPDLKQFVMNLVCWGDGDIPAFLELADGNQADKKRFAPLLQAFKEQWGFEGLYVADSALYSEANIRELGSLRWLTRVPLSLREAQELVSHFSESALGVTSLDGYRIGSVGSQYGGVDQRWVVVESRERQQADLRKLEKTVAQATRQAQSQVKQLTRQDFACGADALKAGQQLEQRLEWHRLEDIQVVEKTHYQRPGKPKPGTLPHRITYHLHATPVLREEVVNTHRQRAGRFILATNLVDGNDSEFLSDEQLLQAYKGQQGNERGFRFLKDPLFFASSVFLKAPERIMALAMVMGLCLLVYNLGQRQLRQALKTNHQSLPNQLGQDTQKPTLRWVFQCFMAIHYVVLNGTQQIVNLRDKPRHILQFLGAACQKYYLLC
jgi:transposase